MVPRSHCRRVYDALNEFTVADLADMQSRVASSFHSEGITFTVYGEGMTNERIIPIDCISRLLTASEWEHLEAGLTQRLRALNFFLQDIYNEARIVADGVIPTDIIRNCPQYRVAMRGLLAFLHRIRAQFAIFNNI